MAATTALALAQVALHVARALESGSIVDKAGLQEAKREAAGKSGIALPSDSDVAELLPAPLQERFKVVLRTKPTRSRSGVAVVAVMSSPASCPHGKCIFCPGGPEANAPQSYTGFEPSTMRAKSMDYDPYRIVRSRLAQLQRNGHSIDKVDIVIQGGTFPAREPAYQDWFVAGIYAGLNAGPADATPQDTEHSEPAEIGSARSATSASRLAAASVAGWASESSWSVQPEAERRRRLDALMLANEDADCRAIGLTIETKPDWCFEEHLDRMLAYGATRVEIGLQALDDEVLRKTHRGHTLEDSRRSMQLARDAGFKVCVHMMPGLPRGKARRPETSGSSEPGVVSPPDPWATDEAADVDDFRRLFAEPDWRPDMLKVYPTLVVQEGETPLKRLWQEGKYTPFDSTVAARVVGAGKSFVPAWCRIQRIDRDIPTTHVEAGVMNSNLRQLAQQWRREQGLPGCSCIRCREVGARLAEGREVREARLQILRHDYEAGHGTEVFLSFEDPEADAVAGFLRLRRVSSEAHRSEVDVVGGAAFVRELKVYGTAQAIGAHDDPDEGAWQHRGYGARLLREAERIAFHEWGVGRLLVIAGVGVKAYYRKHGYVDLGAYVAKGRP